MEQVAESVETLIEEMTQDWSKLSPERDGLDLAAAHIRLAYGAGYTTGLSERQEHLLAAPPLPPQ